MDREGKKLASLERSIKSELEWVRSSAKGQVKKGKARLRVYDDLVGRYALNTPLILPSCCPNTPP
jgi:hypothetical protein